MKILLTSDSRNFFDNPLINFEHELLMSEMDKKSLRKPLPLSILSFIKTDCLSLFSFRRIVSINAGSWEHTIVGSSTSFVIFVSLSLQR